MSHAPKNKLTWQSQAAFATLRFRAEILTKIRQFFLTRNILEVETPLLSQAIGTDPHLHFFTTELNHPDLNLKQIYYLQTSPEFAMKRLLAQGIGSIYQITKAFRNSDMGQIHNPEFTILEWYRTGFTYTELMQEVGELLKIIIPSAQLNFLTYRQVFLNYVNFNPITATPEFISQFCQKNLNLNKVIADKDTGLQLIMAELIEPSLPSDNFIFIYDYPASQAALSTIKSDDPTLAERFEVYYNGLELANGFQELTHHEEQYQRFLKDIKKRKILNYPIPPIDQNFLAALEHGLPFCAGVALGIDRLIMAACNAKHINKVISFTHELS